MTKTKQKSLFSLSMVTFLNYAARGLTFPFISLYLVAVGFSGVQIGTVLSISAAVRLFLPSLLNMLADRLSRHRQFFYGLVTGNAIATFGLVLAQVSQQLLAAVVVIRDSLDMPSASLLSQLTITQLEEQERDIYGQIRAWGSLGWAVTTMVSGLIFAAGGYAFIFTCAALCNLLSLPFSRTLPAQTRQQATDEKPKRESDVFLRRSTGFYWLMVIWFLFYVGLSAISAFAYVYFQQSLGASNAMIGVLASVAALAEIPSMIFIDRLMRRVNIRITLLLGMLGMAGLWFAYTLLNGVAFLIPLMMIRGTFYTFQNVSITLLVSRISHPRNAATNQAIAQVTVPALAVLITGPIVGWMFDTFGGRILFRSTTLVAIIAAILLFTIRQRLTENVAGTQEISR
jgi:predicted MFS family arabinose efflux permease